MSELIDTVTTSHNRQKGTNRWALVASFAIPIMMVGGFLFLRNSPGSAATVSDDEQESVATQAASRRASRAAAVRTWASPVATKGR